MKNKRFLILLAALALLIGGAAAGYRILSSEYSPDAPSNTDSQSAEEAPDFIVLDAQGESVKLSDHEGKPVILNFWATWCGPCKSELPAFDAAYQAYGEEIDFMMVNLTDGTRETEELVKKFVAENGYTFPVYYDTLSSAVNAYWVNGVPVTYFIDSSGNIVQSYMGAMSAETLERYIDLLKEEAV